MKIKLIVNLDIPDKYSTASDQELRILLYEEFMRTVHQSHLETVMELATVDQGGEYVSDMLKQTRQHHLEWAKITDMPDWTVERL